MSGNFSSPTSQLWTIVILQGISTLLLLAGIAANYWRVQRMRADLARHRVNLERALTHMESELCMLRAGRSNGSASEAEGEESSGPAP